MGNFVLGAYIWKLPITFILSFIIGQNTQLQKAACRNARDVVVSTEDPEITPWNTLKTENIFKSSLKANGDSGWEFPASCAAAVI